MKKLIFILFVLLVSSLLPQPARAMGSAVVISEVQTQSAAASSEEFVELYNSASLPTDVTGWKVEYITASNSTVTELAVLQGQIVANGFVLLSKTGYMPGADGYFDKGLSESGGHIRLIDAAGHEVDRLGWGTASAAEGQSATAPEKAKSLRRESNPAALFADTDNNGGDFIAAAPDPHSGGLMAAEHPSSPDFSDCAGVVISEILPNPAGADVDGGEFIELYNDGDKVITLSSCSLSTDKLADFVFPTQAILTPDSYFVAELKDDLLNSGGIVTLQGTTEESVTYPAVDEGASWALIGGEWQQTAVPTPGKVNILATAPPRAAHGGKGEAVEESKPCAPGKFRNPETNRCKTIVSASPGLTPCKSGQTRNPETHRCRAAGTTASTTLTPCSPGQERNPATNRCRKIAAATSATLKPCAAGQERNPETNRCRKVATTRAASSQGQDESANKGVDKVNLGILAAAGTAAAGYGTYEYRNELRNWFHKLRMKFVPGSSE